MRFLLDENIDVRLRAFLRHLGHDATAIATDYPRSITDPNVLTLAHSEQRILITHDSDFGELVFNQRQPHTGVIYFRLHTTRYGVLEARMAHVLARFADRLDQYLVVTDSSVRIRRGRTN